MPRPCCLGLILLPVASPPGVLQSQHPAPCHRRRLADSYFTLQSGSGMECIGIQISCHPAHISEGVFFLMPFQ
ncbi:hypothetical protein FB45DRAFT_939273 [Roridomyces roridus]|uniref:Secreted protein n=1 Tax=Roridomyces roridus TaxID=1738132 RepID=A0AAD7B7Q3_9AGAR|nr:hypothetical protein FB45DRAFT_939273 [Roridomyces roridus]